MDMTFDPIETSLFPTEPLLPNQGGFEFPLDVAADTSPIPQESISLDQALSSDARAHQPVIARTGVLYVDADNQLPLCAGALVETCRLDLAVGVLRAVIAGNDSGRQVAKWAEALRARIEDIAIHPLNVPTRKEAADLALVMELGANLKDHIAWRDLVIIVSRDDFLIGAAERARSLGCACIIAYGSGPPVNPKETSLPTLLLPIPDKGTPASAAPRPLPSMAPPPVAGSPEKTALTASQILAKVRAELPQQPDGGYAPGPLGSFLAKLGLKAKARKQFLSETRGVRTLGSGPDKRYLFSD